MAKKEQKTEKAAGKPSVETVLLRVIGPEGTIKEFPREKAERILAYEKYSGIIAHELYEPDGRTDSIPDQGAEE